MFLKSLKFRLAAVTFFCFFSTLTPAQTPGVTTDRIIVGQSAAFAGPAKALGLGMRQGLEAAFDEVNRSGGVHGRSIELLALDDGYEPERAIVNTNKLIQDHQVFALIGAVGTPTSKAAQPIARDAGVPFIAPFTGAGFLRDPQNDHVVNIRGTYGQETEAWIQHLTEDLDHQRIAILYQDDSFGRVGLAGVEQALEKRGMTLAATGTYQRNSVAVKTALMKIRRAKPESIVMVGSYKPIAEFVKLAHRLKLDATFVTISFVGSKALAHELGDIGEGVVVTQVVPFYEDKNLPVVNRYHSALKALDPTAEPGFVSLEGYLAGRLFIAALEKLGQQIDRETLIQVFQQSPVSFELGGVTLSYGPGDNQGMDKVYLSVLGKEGRYRYVDKLTRAIHTADND